MPWNNMELSMAIRKWLMIRKSLKSTWRRKKGRRLGGTLKAFWKHLVVAASVHIMNNTTLFSIALTAIPGFISFAILLSRITFANLVITKKSQFSKQELFSVNFAPIEACLQFPWAQSNKAASQYMCSVCLSMAYGSFRMGFWSSNRPISVTPISRMNHAPFAKLRCIPIHVSCAKQKHTHCVLTSAVGTSSSWRTAAWSCNAVGESRQKRTVIVESSC